MKLPEIIEKLKNGSTITKSTYNKWTRKKIVRGESFDIYTVDEERISRVQFEKLAYELKILQRIPEAEKGIHERKYIYKN